ncbi:MAG: DUF488 domain-containing protein [PS1 clade bacterium]|uniref:DUF488 domain-containing protein n=1 Tax=PS1 clade bacterium TaxID=2175152 RepID=A0A937L373_9PROT|nr:DUF488 domain-containing protein [PS1 clade bacterium]
MRLNTLGFTKKNAETFFSRLLNARVKKLIDVRLNNSSQLSGFAKKDDLAYFCRQHGIDYVHMPELAPTKEILDDYKKHKGSWGDYEVAFHKLMTRRQIEKIDPLEIDGGCLLCSEDKPHECHRRLVAEYLRDNWGNVEINHL